MTVGEKIKKMRLEKGFTQEQFGEMIGVCKQCVSFWELGKTNASINAIKKFSEAIGLNMDEFLNMENNGPHWVSMKERPPRKSGEYVCTALLPDERGGARKLISVYTFERTSDADKAGRWEAPRSIIAYWLEGLEMPNMEGIL